MASASSRNFGASPQTFNAGGGNGFSRQFYDRNQDYMGAGDWRNTDRNPSDDGYRIDARAGASMPGTGPGTGNTSIPMGRGFGGLNYFNALQNRNIPAFRQNNQGTPWGLGNSAQEAGANLTQSGNILRADGSYVPDTMYNRTLGSNPYSGGNQAPQQAPQGPNEDQQRWAQQFADEQRQPMAPQTPNQTGGNSLFGAVGLNPATGMGKNPSSFQGYSAPQASSAPSAPTNFSRSALIQGAQKSGEFGKIMEDYNAKAKAAGTGMQMDSMGNINPLSKLADEQGTSPFARATLGAGAEDIRARRNFERGESLDGSVSGGVGALTKINPYGTASSTFAPSTGVRQGMMPDPLTGKMVPMRQWAADQSAVQATKEGTSGWGDGRTFNQAGEDYFNKGVIAKDIESKMPATKRAVPSRPTVNSPNMNPYSRLSTAMTGDAGTIKTTPTAFAPKMPPAPNYTGITTDYSGIRDNIATMAGNKPPLDTIKSAAPFGVKKPLDKNKGQELLKKTLGTF